MIGDYKEVYFEDYCPKCKYKNNIESCDECDECLDNCVNQDSHKPIRFEEEKEK
jgi:hypothetical protein